MTPFNSTEAPELFVGGAEDDTFVPGNADTAQGNGGDDVFILNNGNFEAGNAATIDGGEGVDGVTFNMPGVILLSLLDTDPQPLLPNLTLTLSNVENVTVINGDPGLILGNPADKVLSMEGGNNLIFGLGGDDTISLGRGDDTALGGAGDDAIFDLAINGTHDLTEDDLLLDPGPVMVPLV